MVGFAVCFIASCEASTNSKIAGVKNFYFEIIDNIQSDFSLQLVEQISETLPQNDYLISEESAAQGWPFFGIVPRGSEVLKTDMMPPHSNVNRLTPIRDLKNYNTGEHKMKAVFTINNSSSETISISKESFEWKDGSWVKFSKKLETEFEIDLTNADEVYAKAAKTLIRYTFK